MLYEDKVSPMPPVCLVFFGRQHSTCALQCMIGGFAGLSAGDRASAVRGAPSTASMLDTWQWPLLLDISLAEGGLLDDSLAAETTPGSRGCPLQPDGSQQDPKQQAFSPLSASEESELPQHLRLSFGSISELPAHEFEELLGSGWSESDPLMSAVLLPMPPLTQQQPPAPFFADPALGSGTPAASLPPHSAPRLPSTGCTASPPRPPPLLQLLQLSPGCDAPPPPPTSLTPSRPRSASSLDRATQQDSPDAVHSGMTACGWQPLQPQPQPQQTAGSEDSSDSERQVLGRKRRTRRDDTPEKLKQLFQTKQEQNRRNQADCRARKKVSCTSGSVMRTCCWCTAP